MNAVTTHPFTFFDLDFVFDLDFDLDLDLDSDSNISCGFEGLQSSRNYISATIVLCLVEHSPKAADWDDFEV